MTTRFVTPSLGVEAISTVSDDLRILMSEPSHCGAHMLDVFQIA